MRLLLFTRATCNVVFCAMKVLWTAECPVSVCKAAVLSGLLPDLLVLLVVVPALQPLILLLCTALSTCRPIVVQQLLLYQGLLASRAMVAINQSHDECQHIPPIPTAECHTHPSDSMLMQMLVGVMQLLLQQLHHMSLPGLLLWPPPRHRSRHLPLLLLLPAADRLACVLTSVTPGSCCCSTCRQIHAAGCVQSIWSDIRH
jgi:hypothetical protein